MGSLTVCDVVIGIAPVLLGGYCTWFFWPRGRRRRPFKPIGEGRYLLEEEEQ